MEGQRLIVLGTEKKPVSMAGETQVKKLEIVKKNLPAVQTGLDFTSCLCRSAEIT